MSVQAAVNENANADQAAAIASLGSEEFEARMEQIRELRKIPITIKHEGPSKSKLATDMAVQMAVAVPFAVGASIGAYYLLSWLKGGK